MKTITVKYWHIVEIPGLDYMNGQHFIYSRERRNEIIDDILFNGYSVMLRPNGEELIIWIDSGNFRQR